MNLIEALLELARQGVRATVLADKSLVGWSDLTMAPIVRPSIRRSPALIRDVHGSRPRQPAL
jgi:hypothetical protein